MGQQATNPAALDPTKQRAQTPGGNPQSTPFADIIRASQGGVDPQQYIRQSLGLGVGQRATPAATNAAVLGASNPALIQQFLAQHSANIGTPGFLRQPGGGSTPQLSTELPFVSNPTPPQQPPGGTGTLAPGGQSLHGIPSPIPAGRPWANNVMGGSALSPLQMQQFQAQQQAVMSGNRAAALAQQQALQPPQQPATVTRLAPPLRRAPVNIPPPIVQSRPNTSLSDIGYLVTGLHRSR